MSRVSFGAFRAETAVDLSGGNFALVLTVFVIALVALAMAVVFRRQVLAAGEGTQNMKNIAQAVQEGAAAYLTRQFRTLGAVANFGVGYDNVDVAEAGRRGVQVSNTPDVLTDCVAEVAVGLVLDVLHRLSAADRYVRAGRWESDGAFPLTRQLSARRVGLLGLGRIGREIARRLEPFGCSLTYHSRTQADDVPFGYADSPTALAEAVDVLVVCVPGGPATAGLVDRAVLERLGPDGVLVNIARGSVVDEEALVELLVDGRLGGAGLDVYADEPRVPEALMALDQVVLLPHVGSATEETREAMGQLVLDNVRSFLDDGSLVTPVPT